MYITYRYIAIKYSFNSSANKILKQKSSNYCSNNICLPVAYSNKLKSTDAVVAVKKQYIRLLLIAAALHSVAAYAQMYAKSNLA